MTTSYTMKMIDRVRSSVLMWGDGRQLTRSDLLKIIELATEAERTRIEKAMDEASLLDA